MSKLNTFDDFAQVSDLDIQRTMRHVDQNTLLVALKACSEQTKEKILGNMSERVRGFITDEMQRVSSTSAEIDEAQRVALAVLAVVQASDPA
mgnify:FL=1|jgi:flagellar motor switch protein FliG